MAGGSNSLEKAMAAWTSMAEPPALSSTPTLELNAQEPGVSDSACQPVMDCQVTPEITEAATASTHTDTGFDPAKLFALSDLLIQLEDYTPTVPDAVSNYYLQKAGFDSVDPRIARLISVATQKFMSDIINESFTLFKLKQALQAGHKPKKYVLTLEDVVPVLGEYGLTVKKPPYFM